MEVTTAELEHRVTACEKDIKDIQKRQSEIEIEQAKINTKLDNMLVQIGEIKSSIEQIAKRPSVWWDKLVGAILCAIGAGIGAVLINLLKG